MRQFLRKHSLSMASMAIGTLMTVYAMWLLDEGKWFDLCISIGTGFLVVGAVGLGQGPLREVNKPEK